MRSTEARRVAALVACLFFSACSLQKLAVNRLADALAESGAVYARDDDPELVADALPFALKTMETLLEEQPRHQGLLVAAARGFTQYAYAFVQLPAERLEEVDFLAGDRMNGRALKLYLRARDYGLQALELDHPGLAARLREDPGPAVAVLQAAEVERIYWVAAAWGAAIAAGLDRPDLVADLPAVRALFARALALDEEYDRGALHEAFITLESLSPALGGSPEKARQHFERAVQLSAGQRAGPYVTYAQKTAVATQDRGSFVRYLEAALAIDADAVPRERLTNLVLQEKARWLLERADDLFLPAELPEGETGAEDLE